MSIRFKSLRSQTLMLRQGGPIGPATSDGGELSRLHRWDCQPGAMLTGIWMFLIVLSTKEGGKATKAYWMWLVNLYRYSHSIWYSNKRYMYVWSFKLVCSWYGLGKETNTQEKRHEKTISNRPLWLTCNSSWLAGSAYPCGGGLHGEMVTATAIQVARPFDSCFLGPCNLRWMVWPLAR